MERTSQWGRGKKKLDSLTRFFAFCLLHLTFYFMSLAVMIYLLIHVNWTIENIGKEGYILALAVAHAIVGVYLTLLAWGDPQLRRFSSELCGFFGRVLVSVFMGFTQLIQLKVAWSKYARRQLVEEDEESAGEEEEAQDNQETRVPLQESSSRTTLEQQEKVAETRRVARMENAIPWAFPAKCFEGIFEATIFVLVIMFAILKLSWAADPVSLALENHGWYIFTANIFIPFCWLTMGVSMLNFDYHLSPSVAKAADHSIWYSFLHVAFRGCETGSRIMQIVFICLAFHACDNTVLKSAPYVYQFLNYLVCVVILLTISAREERRYRSMNTVCGTFKRITASCLIGTLNCIANVSEFVDEGERTALRSAAYRFSRAVRFLRLVELIGLMVFLVLFAPCNLQQARSPVPQGDWGPTQGACDWGLDKDGVVASCLICNKYYDPRSGYGDNANGWCVYVPSKELCYPGSWAQQQSFETQTDCQAKDSGTFFSSNGGVFRYLWEHHKVILLTSILATIFYYVLVLMGFHNKALESTVETRAEVVGLTPVDPELAPHQAPRSAPSHTTAPDAAGPSVSSAPLLPGGEQSAAPAEEEASPVADPRSSQRQVLIIAARDSELPEALRPPGAFDDNNMDTWYHNDSPQLTVRRAPGLSFLLLSRGLPGEFTRMVLTPVDEDIQTEEGSVSARDVVAPGERVQMSDFDVLNILGEGSYAPVVKCRKRSTGEIFAMKRLIKQNYVQPRSAVERVLPQRERDTLCLSGRHPNVAYLECAFSTDTFWVLVTEFCDIGSLNKYVRKKGKPGLTPDMAARISGQTLMGLAHIHSFDILHRDVKPDNIGLSGTMDEPVAKLIDFGFAKRADAKQSRTIVGSYGYCAPEIDHAREMFGALRQAREYYDLRVDLYSFGICLFVMFVGREAIDQQGTLWTHRQFRTMLRDPAYPMWYCPRYRKFNISGDDVLQTLRECGAFQTISKLTETQPQDRPPTARDAGRLPLFARYPASVPDEWLPAETTTGTPRASEISAEVTTAPQSLGTDV